MDIRENIASIQAALEQELATLDDIRQLDEVRQRVLGKKGTLTALLRSMGQLSPEERLPRQPGQGRHPRRPDFSGRGGPRYQGRERRICQAHKRRVRLSPHPGRAKSARIG